jgi:hypothetical protein
MSHEWVEGTVDYIIPDRYKGQKLPETDILVPEEAYGMIVEPGLYCSKRQEASVAVFYDYENILDAQEMPCSARRLIEIVEQFFEPKNQ